jgi:hypothetical protein
MFILWKISIEHQLDVKLTLGPQLLRAETCSSKGPRFKKLNKVSSSLDIAWPAISTYNSLHTNIDLSTARGQRQQQ